MSLSLVLGCLWVVAAAVVAFLPYRMQFPPGILLLLAAPVLIGFLGYQHGALAAGIAFAAFASMFRNPLRFLLRKAFGALRRDGGGGS